MTPARSGGPVCSSRRSARCRRALRTECNTLLPVLNRSNRYICTDYKSRREVIISRRLCALRIFEPSLMMPNPCLIQNS
jgi:hypothetical protein